MSVKRTECGWAGHYCCADYCKFRRNTHLERNGISIVVSTIGNHYQSRFGIIPVGANRYSETKVFYSKIGDNYNDADVSREIYLNGISCLGETNDWEINEMHENAVKEITERLETGEFDDCK